MNSKPVRHNILAALLLLSLLVSLVSCAGTADTVSTTAAGQGDTTAAQSATEDIAPDLPSYDFGGEELRFLVKEEGGVGRWTSIEIYSEEENGEVINDAVYKRNSIIEDKYNVKIAQTYTSAGSMNTFGMYKEISKLVLAGDTTYDIVMPTLEDCAMLGRDGLLLDMNTLNTDLSKPWWNQMIASTTSIGGKTFYATGDISVLAMQATYIMLFNKDNITDLALESPYDIVRRGEWTIDKLLEMSRVFTKDLNGDGVLNDEDNNGTLIINNYVRAAYTASGQLLITPDKDGKLSFTGDTARSVEVLEKIYQLFEARDAVLCVSDQARVSGASAGMDHVTFGANVFSAGRGLFLAGTMWNVPTMRSMDADFGIIPLPKIDGKQPEYYSFVHPWAASAVAIPITSKDAARASAVLEDMAYQAMKIITPAYYEISIKTKFSRDEDSKEMLDLIFENRVLDIGYLFDIGKMVSGLEDLIYAKRKDNFTSFIESKKAAVDKELQVIQEGYNAAE
ncbi:MAG: extracellular solute-binding protein [Eubacteriales bacterium]